MSGVEGVVEPIVEKVAEVIASVLPAPIPTPAPSPAPSPAPTITPVVIPRSKISGTSTVFIISLVVILAVAGFIVYKKTRPPIKTVS